MADTEKDKLQSLMNRIKARKRHEDNKVQSVQKLEREVQKMEK